MNVNNKVPSNNSTKEQKKVEIKKQKFIYLLV